MNTTHSSGASTIARPAPSAATMLHVVNGHSTAQTLRKTGLPGALSVQAEVLHEGPTPGGVSPTVWRQTRARFYTNCGWVQYASAMAGLRKAARSLQACSQVDEVILWLEHDLLDQLLLMRTLDELSRRDLGSAKLSLICIDRFPGIERFMGMGQLNEEQLASLFETRRPVSPAQTKLAQRAWRAFTGADPTEIERLLATDTSALPFLASALWRHLEQFPSVRNGLGRTEQQALEIASAGPRSAVEVFLANNEREVSLYLGDLVFWRYLEHLASEPAPLLALDPPLTEEHSFACREVSLTTTGRSVLDGTADWPGLAGIDRWLGGVQLQGHEPAWRWDERERHLVAAPA